MKEPNPHKSHVVVADARPRDYREPNSPDGQWNWRVHFLSGGAAAVQYARRRRADLWLINSRLPDISGFELLSVLRNLPVDAPICMVADQYDSGEEKRACAGGANLYLCKDERRQIDLFPLLDNLTGSNPTDAEADTEAFVGR